MTDPTYTYVRGKGWVIEPIKPPCAVSPNFLLGSKLYRLEHRKPEFGERFDAFVRDSMWWSSSERIPNWDEWIREVRFNAGNWEPYNGNPAILVGWTEYVVLCPVEKNP